MFSDVVVDTQHFQLNMILRASMVEQDRAKDNDVALRWIDLIDMDKAIHRGI